MFDRWRSKQEQPTIHPDFVKRDGFWTWNFNNFGTYIQKIGVKRYNVHGIIKVAFPFDDPSLLDSCPFMCKVGKNDTSNPDAQWFGVAYGYKDENYDDTKALEQWASRFPRHELITTTTDIGETVEQPTL